MRIPSTGSFALLGLCLTASCATAQLHPGPPSADSSPRQISAVGTATVSLPPNRASVTVGIATSGESLDSTLAAHREAVELVVDAIRQLVVAPGSIEVTRDGIGGMPFGADAITSYRVSSRVVATLEGTAGADDVLRAAAAAGANQLGAVRYFASDRSDAEREALTLALKDARSRAELLARRSGVKLGPVIAVADGAAGRMLVGGVRGGAALSGGVGLGFGGDEQVTVNVSVTYALQ